MKTRVTQVLKCILAGTGGLLFGTTLQFAVAQDSENLPYQNAHLSPEQRATDLVHRMTLAEKASEMQNNSAAVPLWVPQCRCDALSDRSYLRSSTSLQYEVNSK